MMMMMTILSMWWQWWWWHCHWLRNPHLLIVPRPNLLVVIRSHLHGDPPSHSSVHILYIKNLSKYTNTNAKTDLKNKYIYIGCHQATITWGKLAALILLTIVLCNTLQSNIICYVFFLQCEVYLKMCMETKNIQTCNVQCTVQHVWCLFCTVSLIVSLLPSCYVTPST